jgi:hypothetical protein
MKETFNRKGNRQIRLTLEEWIFVCNTIDLNNCIPLFSHVRCGINRGYLTKMGRWEAIMSRAIELYGNAFFFHAPPEINYRLNERQKREIIQPAENLPSRQ